MNKQKKLSDVLFCLEILKDSIESRDADSIDGVVKVLNLTIAGIQEILTAE